MENKEKEDGQKKCNPHLWFVLPPCAQGFLILFFLIIYKLKDRLNFLISLVEDMDFIDGQPKIDVIESYLSTLTISLVLCAAYCSLLAFDIFRTSFKANTSKRANRGVRNEFIREIELHSQKNVESTREEELCNNRAEHRACIPYTAIPKAVPNVEVLEMKWPQLYIVITITQAAFTVSTIILAAKIFAGGVADQTSILLKTISQNHTEATKKIENFCQCSFDQKQFATIGREGFGLYQERKPLPDCYSLIQDELPGIALMAIFLATFVLVWSLSIYFLLCGCSIEKGTSDNQEAASEILLKGYKKTSVMLSPAEVDDITRSTMNKAESMRSVSVIQKKDMYFQK